MCNDANGGTVQLRNNIFSGNLTLAAQTGGTVTPDPSAFISSFNTVYTDNSSVQLSNPFAIYPNIPLPANNVSNWMPAGGSPALSGSDFTNPNLSGFQSVSYRGAFGTNNWTTGWSQFNPINYLIPVTSNYFITVFPEGFYNNVTGKLNNSDSVRIYLRNSAAPYAVVDSSIAVIDKTTFQGKFVFKYADNGTYYIQTKHRNSIETWSKAGGQSFTKAADNYFDFTTSASQAYGNNQKTPGGGKYGIFSGDNNQDGVVDLDDLIIVYNSALIFASGFVVADNNYDEIVDLSDLVIGYNNGLIFTSVIRP